MTSPPSSPSRNCFSLHPQYTYARLFLTVFWFLRMQCPYPYFMLGKLLQTFSKFTFSVKSFLTHPGRVRVSSLAALSPLSQTLLCCPVLSPALWLVCAHQPQGQSCAYDGTSCVLWVRKIPWRRTWQHTPVFLLGKSNGQRSLEGYSPWGCKSWTRLSD